MCVCVYVCVCAYQVFVYSVNELLFYRVQEKEETCFKLTNSFSTVDSRSAVKLSEEYKCIQHHDRLAAARAHKNAYAGCDPVPFHQHTMVYG